MDWWTKIREQVNGMLEDLTFRGIYADDIEWFLGNDDWLDNDYLNSHMFQYEKAEFTLKGLVDTFELLTGDARAFQGAIKYNLLEMIKDKRFERVEDHELFGIG